MSDVVSATAVIDLDAMLQPVSEESPAGESLRYSGLYDEIVDARRSDDVLNQGDWQTELKVADYRKVKDLAVPALTSQAKDLQVSAWLSESLIRLHSFAGLRDSLKLVAGLQDQFWDSLFPIIEDGDMEGRANAISWMDTQGSAALKSCPITGGPEYSYNDFLDAKTFDIPGNLDSLDADTQARYQSLKTQAETEGRVTADMWKMAVAKTKRKQCEEMNATIAECWDAYAELNRVIEERYDRNQMPGLGELKKVLDDVHGQVKKLLEKKRLEEPDAADSYTSDDSGSEDVSESSNGSYEGGGGGSSMGGPVKSRPEALKQLAIIAAFFQRTEPHSPVAYLVQRAVKWGNMPLESWLQDVIKDEGVLHQLRQTLGLDAGSGAAAEDDSWGSDSSDDQSSETSTETASDDW